MLMLTKYQFLFSAIMIFTDITRKRMTVRFWISVPDGPDAIYIFYDKEILARLLANFHCLIFIVNKRGDMKL